jgi:6-phosphogluconate dehydrogenase
MAVDIGLIGLAVMGENLALNFASKGYGVGVYDIREGVAQALAQKSGLKAADSLEQLIEMLEKPRKVMLMIRAGSPVDEVIASLLPLLSPGDVIIDGGNSFYEDTIRRTKLVESHGLLYIGTGISG